MNKILVEALPFLSGLDPHVVGGAVRDRLLKRPTLDIDISTNSDPHKAALKLADHLQGSAFRLDEEFGITRITTPEGIQIDLSKIQGKDRKADLDRRDFTVNAMSVPLEDWLKSTWQKKIVDLHGGQKDLKKKIIQPVSNHIFKEDPIRLLRGFRIAAELSFSLSPAALSLIKKDKQLIKKTAPERIREEMLKLFCVEFSHDTVVLMDKVGILDELLPEFKKLKKTGHVYYGSGGVLKHTLDSLMLLEGIFEEKATWFPKVHKKIEEYLQELKTGYPRLAHLKWGVLLHDLGKPDTAEWREGRLRFFEHEHVGAEKVPALAKQFRWSSYESELYARLVRNHMRPGNLATHEKQISEKALHRFFRDLGEDAIGMLLVSLGDHLSYLTPRERKARKSPHEVLTKKMVNMYYLERQKVLPERILSGHDVMKTFKLKPSPVIGAMLRDVMEAQTEGKVKTRDDALDFLKARIDSYKDQENKWTSKLS